MSDERRMIVTICGSRSIRDSDLVEHLISNSGFDITEVVHGGAVGVDTIAGEWAKKRLIPTTVIRPQWNVSGLRAGLLRNEDMVRMCDAVIAIWNGTSRGTAYTISYAQKVGKPVKIWRV